VVVVLPLALLAMVALSVLVFLVFFLFLAGSLFLRSRWWSEAVSVSSTACCWPDVLGFSLIFDARSTHVR
jgi:hypothetical protein